MGVPLVFALVLSMGLGIVEDCAIQPQVGYDEDNNAYVRFETNCPDIQFCRLSWGLEDEHELLFLNRFRATTWHPITMPYEIICGDSIGEEDVRPNSSRSDWSDNRPD